MKKLARQPLLVALILTTFLAVGCAEKDDEEQSEALSDQEALTQMMLEDEEVEGLNAWSGDDDASIGEGGLDDPVTPLRWGRIGRRQLDRVTVEVIGDTFATITRYATFNGVIRVVTDTAGNSRQYIDKAMYNSLVRKAHAVRVGRSPRPRLNWRITEITPEVLASASPNPHTIWPTVVDVYRASVNGLELLASVSDPLESYFSREDLPSLATGDTIIVRVTGNRAGAESFLHPRVFQRGPHPRRVLADDGVYPDEMAGDGVYSGQYVLGNQMGVFMAGVDLIDHETLYDSAGPYDASGWGCPYRVTAPAL